MTINERKEILFRRIKDGLSPDLLTNVGDVASSGSNIPNVPINAELDLYLDDLLTAAKDVIFEVRFPFREYPDDVETRYHSLQIKIAVEINSKEGAEGEVSHSEDGIGRTYSSADISYDLLDKITPLCGV